MSALVIGPEQRAEISAAIDKAKLNTVLATADWKTKIASASTVDLGAFVGLYSVMDTDGSVFRHLTVVRKDAGPTHGPMPEIVKKVMVEFGFVTPLEEIPVSMAIMPNKSYVVHVMEPVTDKRSSLH